jgi:hypothetical protein
MAEKARGAGVGLIGVVLGFIEIVLASFIISFATYFSMMISEITRQTQYYTPPQYYSGLLGATSSLLMFGGIYVLVHAIKRIVDQGFMAYLSTKTQERVKT